MRAMKETVYVADVTLTHLAQALEDSRLVWVYAKRLEDIVLSRLSNWSASDIPLARWDYGCAFGPELELCWWRCEDQYQVRAITEETPPGDVQWDTWDTSKWHTDESSPWLLVGEHDADRDGDVPTWSEARIPRYLAYPVPNPDSPPERVALVAQTCREAGKVVLRRLIRVEGG